MLNEKLVSLINQQVNMELHSAYLYLAIAGHYADEELNGFANWFRIQAKEERDHAMLFAKYLANNNAKLELFDVKAPHADMSDNQKPLLASLKHEQAVTASITNIYAQAHELKDYRSMQFLDWFIKEQNEEEKNAEALIKRYDLFGKDGHGLYLLDAELGQRTYSPPSLQLD